MTTFWVEKDEDHTCDSCDRGFSNEFGVGCNHLERSTYCQNCICFFCGQTEKQHGFGPGGQRCPGLMHQPNQWKKYKNKSITDSRCSKCRCPKIDHTKWTDDNEEISLSEWCPFTFLSSATTKDTLTRLHANLRFHKGKKI